MRRFDAEKFEVYRWRQARDAARAQDEGRAAAVRQQLAEMGFAVANADDDLLRDCGYNLQHVIECLVKVGAGAGRGAVPGDAAGRPKDTQDYRRRAAAARGARRQDHGRGARRASRQRPEEAANVDAPEAIADEELEFPTRKHMHELTGLHTYTYAHMYIYMNMYMYMCIYMYLYMDMYACM